MTRNIKISAEMVDIVNQRCSVGQEDVADVMDRLETISDVISDHTDNHGLFARFYSSGRYDGLLEMAFGEDIEDFRDFIYKELPELKDQILSLVKEYHEEEGNIDFGSEEESLLGYLAELSYDFDSSVTNSKVRDNIAYRVILQNFSFILPEGVREAHLSKIVLSSGNISPAGISLERGVFLPVLKVQSNALKKKEGPLFVKFSGAEVGRKISTFLEDGRFDPEDIIQGEIMKGFECILKEEYLKPFLREEITKRAKALASREARKEKERKEAEKKAAKRKAIVEDNKEEILQAILLRKELDKKLEKLASLGLNVSPDNLENL